MCGTDNSAASSMDDNGNLLKLKLNPNGFKNQVENTKLGNGICGEEDHPITLKELN